VIVLALLVVGLALGAVAVTESVDAHKVTNQDARERRAQQATDAGISSQLYQESEQNIANTLSLASGPLRLATLADCLVPQASATGVVSAGSALVSAYANSAGVCPGYSTGGTLKYSAVTQALGNHVYEQSEFFPGATSLNGGTLFPKIVSLGWDDNGGSGSTVYQRQLAILAPIAPLRVLEAEGSLTINGAGASLGGVSLGASTAYGNVSAAKNLTTPTSFTVGNLDNLSNGILGSVTYGGTYSGFLTVPYPTKTTTPVLRQPVSVSSTKASCPDTLDTCSGISYGYNATTDTFSLTAGHTATFAAGDYVLCSFDAEGGTVTMAPTSSTPVRIFIDSPSSARCNSSATNAALNQYNDKSDANRGNFIAKTGVVNSLLTGLSGTPQILASSGVQVYVVGDQNTTNTYDDGTTVTIGSCSSLLCSNPTTEGMVVYAPTSRVSLVTGACTVYGVLCTGGVFEGALIGDDVTASALSFSENLAIGNYPLYNGVEVFHPVQYVQCSSQPYVKLAGVTTYYTSLQGDPAIDTNGC
jgi:hypothetical protein